MTGQPHDFKGQIPAKPEPESTKRKSRGQNTAAHQGFKDHGQAVGRTGRSRRPQEGVFLVERRAWEQPLPCTRTLRHDTAKSRELWNRRV